MKRLLFYILITGIGVSFSFSCTGSGKPGQSLYEKGYNNLKAGDITQAKANFEQAYAEYPESPYGPFSMAEYYFSEKLYYKAINSCSEALEIDPEFLPALNMSQKFYLIFDRPELAFYMNSLYYKHGGDTVTAAVADNDIFIYSGKITEAKKFLKEVFPNIPDNPKMILARAFLDLHNGDIPGAFENCRHGYSLGNSDPELVLTVGDFHATLGLIDSAYHYYMQSLNLEPENFLIKREVVERLIDINYLLQAESLLDELENRSGKDNWSYHYRADISTKKGKFNNAELIYGMALPHYREYPSSMINYARIRALTGDAQASDQYFETAVNFIILKEYPENVKYVAALEQVEFVTGLFNVNKAGELVEDVLDNLPNDFKANLDIARIYWIFGREDSLSDYRVRLHEAAEGVPEHQARLAYFYSEAKKPELVRELLPIIYEIDKFNLTAMQAEINILTKLERYQEALKVINGFDEYFSYIPAIAERKLDLYEKSGEFNNGLNFSEQLIEVAPHDISRYRKAVYFAELLDEIDKIGEICRRCMTANEADPNVYILYADHLLGQDLPDSALAFIEQAARLDSNHVEAMALKAFILSDKGETEKAIELLKKCVDLDQYYGKTYNRLALLLLKTDEKPMTAFNLANKSIQYDGANPLSYFALGMVYHKMENFKSARGGFQKALSFEPDNPEFNYYSGLNLIKFGEKAEGTRQIRKAVKLGLSDDLKKEADKYL